jgi:hypothetical protein
MCVGTCWENHPDIPKCLETLEDTENIITKPFHHTELVSPIPLKIQGLHLRNYFVVNIKLHKSQLSPSN